MAKVSRLKNSARSVAETLHPPAHLNARAKQHWEEVLEAVSPGKDITREDIDLLAMYCDFYARWVKAKENIDGMGIIVKSENGRPVANPFIAVADQCATQMRVLLGELGLTPAARRRLRSLQDSHVSSDDIANIQIKVP